jgi:aconitate hydratase
VLAVGPASYSFYRLASVYAKFPQAESLPFSLKILLECLLRTEDGISVRADDIEALATVDLAAPPTQEIAFTPARVLLQDFTGVPAVVDLAAMRDAMKKLGGDPRKIEPLQPVELVIDHSVQVDAFGSGDALRINAQLEFLRNKERYQFLKWGQSAFHKFKVVPPDTGIVHQVNLEYLARVVMKSEDGKTLYPDTLVGTDSHTTMINGLGVLGWGVGGIEAEAAMLGQPVSMLIPLVVGVRVSGVLPEGATATDLVLTVTEMLRKKGVVGKFVEFFGDGLAQMPLADRATIANMAPEYGATCGIFPVDAETLRYLRFTGRDESLVALVESYCKEQGIFHTPGTKEARYADVVQLDLGSIVPSLAGPTRPQDRVKLSEAKSGFRASLDKMLGKSASASSVGASAPIGATPPASPPPSPQVGATIDHQEVQLTHGSVVIAAITSCTNTSNPSVLMAAGLLAKKAVDKGLARKAWVKTSLAPGSKVVTEYLAKAGLTPYLDALGFQTVGYGCTTCIGNSGPLPEAVSKAIEQGSLVVAAVLSGNRNFEGRVHAEVRANYLASPPLVVAYALAGTVDFDPYAEPLGIGRDGEPVFLKDLWPTRAEVQASIDKCIDRAMFERVYGQVFDGDEEWKKLGVPRGDLYAWDESSTYVKHPPYFEGMSAEPRSVADIKNARVLAMLGDSITTDHISPAGSIKKSSPAGVYLIEHGVDVKDFNSYGSRRGNHEVMVRGTFANVRLRNLLTPGTEGGVTRYLGGALERGGGETMSIFDAAMRYAKEGVPLVVLSGKEYGSGSSRDWAAKGPKLLGVRAVIAESYERIHRSNLVGMGIVPLEYSPGENASTLGLTGEETFSVEGLGEAIPRRRATVRARLGDGREREFVVTVRIDTPQEREYYRHGGILPYVLRQLLRTDARSMRP